MLHHLLLWKVSAYAGEMASVESQVNVQSNPRASAPWDRYGHSYTQMLIFRIYKFPYLISSLSISLETNTSAFIFKAFPWNLVIPWYPVRALEAINLRPGDQDYTSFFCLFPWGPYLVWMSSLVSSVFTQRLWSWVSQSPWALEGEDPSIPSGACTPQFQKPLAG